MLHNYFLYVVQLCFTTILFLVCQQFAEEFLNSKKLLVSFFKFGCQVLNSITFMGKQYHQMIQKIGAFVN
jgi:hypothetical protein